MAFSLAQFLVHLFKAISAAGLFQDDEAWDI